MGDITLRKALDDYKSVHIKAIGLPIIERYVAHLEQGGFGDRDLAGFRGAEDHIAHLAAD